MPLKFNSVNFKVISFFLFIRFQFGGSLARDLKNQFFSLTYLFYCILQVLIILIHRNHRVIIV